MGAEASGAAAGANSAKALAGVPFQVAGGVMNLIEASKQAAAKNAADRAAQEAVARAEQEQEKEFLGALQVPTEAYNQALRESTAQQMQALSALTEAGPRELAGGVGRVNAVANNQANDVTNQLADRLYNLDLAQANEKGQNASDLAKLYLGQAEGAQKASMAAQLANRNANLGALGLFEGALAGGVDAFTSVYRQGENEAVSKLPKMPVGMIPNPNTPVIQDVLKQGTISPQALNEGSMNQGVYSPEAQKMLQILMNNPGLLNSLR